MRVSRWLRARQQLQSPEAFTGADGEITLEIEEGSSR